MHARLYLHVHVVVNAPLQARLSLHACIHGRLCLHECVVRTGYMYAWSLMLYVVPSKPSNDDINDCVRMWEWTCVCVSLGDGVSVGEGVGVCGVVILDVGVIV